MDSLDALNKLLISLAASPLDFSLHVKHLELAENTGDESAVLAARELFVDNLAATEQIWLPWLEQSISSLDLSNAEQVEQVLTLFMRAEVDYLSIPILEKHLDFLIDAYEKYKEETMKPVDLGEQFSTEWTRLALEDVVTSGVMHPHRGQNLWRKWCEWEMEQLAEAPKSEKPTLIAHVEKMLLDRLKQGHSAADETFQSYSTFTTNYKPQDIYESLLVSASKIKASAVRVFERRGTIEYATLDPQKSLSSYTQLLLILRRAGKPDVEVVCNAYERAINEAAKQRFSNEPGAENLLYQFWMGYCDFARLHESISATREVSIHRRAVRSIPGCGTIWASFIRLLERFEWLETAPEIEESIPELYERALATQLVDKDIEQIVPLVLARAGYEKRKLESGQGEADALTALIGVVEQGIELVNKASPNGGDPKYRLQKYLAGLYIGALDSLPSAVQVWQTASAMYKTSYVVWIAYTDILIKSEQYDLTRTTFQDIHAKYLDWPEAIWEAWLSFEHLYGTLVDVEGCLDKIGKARSFLEAKRAKEAAYQYQQQQAYSHQESETPATGVDSSMDVDDSQPQASTSGGRGTKRSAEDDGLEPLKKMKMDQPPAAGAVPLKRDRENSTVVVADLPSHTAEDELKALFKDCGEIREIKLTNLPEGLVGMVEFVDRASVPAALTKDKKRLKEQEISVHLAWKSTLYVANFPENLDDDGIREIFGQFGTIFDVRWPSKKFKSTRRFCYIQFTTPSSAEASLSLHHTILPGSESSPELKLDVFISNPGRKKARTDAGNDEKELYVAGLSKFTTKLDLEKVFGNYGKVKEVRMALDDGGQCKGFAFVEFEEEKDALSALAANNIELKRRRMAVTIVDPKAKGKHRAEQQQNESQNRSVRICGLPAGTQEGLLQQVLGKIARVKRVEVFTDKGEAVVELINGSEAGKLLLRRQPIVFQDVTLEVVEELATSFAAPGSSHPPSSARGGRGGRGRGGMFIPRTAASRPRAGLGHGRNATTATTTGVVGNSGSAGSSGSGTEGATKEQDDFRKMLGGGS